MLNLQHICIYLYVVCKSKIIKVGFLKFSFGLDEVSEII